MSIGKKILIGLGVAAAAAAIIAVGYGLLFGWSFVGGESAYYYAQIDNSRVKEVDPDAKIGVFNINGGLPWSYTLTAYDGEGRERELTFGMSRHLTEGAFIRLDVAGIRGVVGWREMQYDELPEAVQNRYTPAEED